MSARHLQFLPNAPPLKRTLYAFSFVSVSLYFGSNVPTTLHAKLTPEETGLRLFQSESASGSLLQSSITSTPTASSPASKGALWDCSTSCLMSHARHQSQPSQHSSAHSSFETDESVGIPTPDHACPVVSQARHQPPVQTQTAQQLSKQSSFELDESLGILTPDQMVDFTVCADSTAVARTPSFEDMDVFLLGDFKGDRAEDLLPDRLPSESDGPSSSNYPSSEYPQFPDDVERLTNADNFRLSKGEDVSFLVNQQQCTPNAVTSVSEDLSDVCPAVSKSSGADFRAVHDISDRTLSPEDLPMDAAFPEVMGEIQQKAEVTPESARDTAVLSGECWATVNFV
jgi:hypothetical protein